MDTSQRLVHRFQATCAALSKRDEKGPQASRIRRSNSFSTGSSMDPVTWFLLLKSTPGLPYFVRLQFNEISESNVIEMVYYDLYVDLFVLYII